jgi:uncharacterized low-complexity protein
MKSTHLKPLTAALGATVLSAALAPTVSAGENPFALNELKSGYQLAQAEPKPAEGKCGEGKCGGEMTGETKGETKGATEGKCGAGGKTSEGKCCGEGKCGGAPAEGT